MLIGKSNDNTDVFIYLNKKHNINNFINISGTAGSGKTSLIKSIIKGAAADNIPCIIFDFSDSYRKKEMTKVFPLLIYRNIEESRLGINPFIAQNKFIEGAAHLENNYQIAERITDLICRCLKIRGEVQKNVLQKAILTEITVNSTNANFSNVAILCGKNAVGKKITALTNPDLFKNPLNWKQLIIPGIPTVIQLSDVSPLNRILFTEMILSDLWNETKKGVLGTYILCIDEIQHLSFSPGSIMDNLIREGRKYNLSLILSTQFTDKKNYTMRELTEQAAMKIFFKPSDSALRSTAKIIDSEKFRDWIPLLQNLKRGEFIFTGNGIVNNNPRDIKAKLHFDYIG